MSTHVSPVRRRRPGPPALLWAALVLLATPVPAGNLLTNPSFEAGTSGWARFPASWPECARVTAGSQGQAGITLECAPPPVEVGYRQRVGVTGGRHYTMRHRVRAAALDGAADVTLTFTGPAGQIWETGVQEVVGTLEWTTLVWAMRAPAWATSLDVRVGVGHGVRGEAGFDDVVLEEAADTSPRELRVDLGAAVGTVRHLGGSNKGPVASGRDGVAVDFTERLQQAGVTVLRQHDVHTAYDMHVVFPDPGADPEEASSYRFATTDEAIRQAQAGGFEVMFRLGESYGEVKGPRMAAAKWAEVVRHVVAHVNGDFASGLRAGVRYWEIWNEANGPLFWAGSPEEFYELFELAAKAVKEADPAARVGGPGVAGHTDESWIRGLLRHLRATAAPLDFFSWHVYHMGNPANLARAQRQVRALVDAEGFPEAEVLNTEWNLNGGQSCERVGCAPFVTGAYNAAHAAAALTYLQDTDIPMAFRYRTDGTGMFGLFGYATEPAWSRSGLAYGLFAHLAATPVRVAASGGDESGFTVLASRSADGADAHVLVVNQGSPAAGYRLSLSGLPARFRWSVEEVTDAEECSAATCATVLVAEGDQDDLRGGVLEMRLAAPAVQLVHLEPTPRDAHVVRRRLPRAR